MQNRKLVSALCAAGLSIGLALGIAKADQSTKPPPPAKTKGKAGDACKTNADCDQSQSPMMCLESKCEVRHISPPNT